MLDPNFVKVLREQIGLAFDEQNHQIEQEAGKLLGSFIQRGVLQSSMTARSIGELYGNDIQIRGEIALGKVKRVFTILRISPTDDIENDLRVFLEELMKAEVDKQYENLNKQPPLKQHESRSNVSSLRQIGGAVFEKAVDHMFRKMRSEITLYAAALKTTAEPVTPGTSSINIHGDVAVIQTGAHASMNISIDTFQRGQITKALDAVRAGLDKARDSDKFNVAEIEEIVSETKAEVQKEKPNAIKLKSMLASIGDAIQTTAALRPAYDSIKSVLSYFGIYLP